MNNCETFCLFWKRGKVCVKYLFSSHLHLRLTSDTVERKGPLRRMAPELLFPSRLTSPLCISLLGTPPSLQYRGHMDLCFFFISLRTQGQSFYTIVVSITTASHRFTRKAADSMVNHTVCQETGQTRASKAGVCGSRLGGEGEIQSRLSGAVKSFITKTRSLCYVQLMPLLKHGK